MKLFIYRYIEKQTFSKLSLKVSVIIFPTEIHTHITEKKIFTAIKTIIDKESASAYFGLSQRMIPCDFDLILTERVTYKRQNIWSKYLSSMVSLIFF